MNPSPLAGKGGPAHRSPRKRAKGLARGETIAVEEDEAGDWRVRFHGHPLETTDRKQNRLRRLGGAASQPENLSPSYPLDSHAPAWAVVRGSAQRAIQPAKRSIQPLRNLRTFSSTTSPAASKCSGL